MTEPTMFERLLLLPVFTGLSASALAEVMTRVRLDLSNHRAGDEVALQGESCRRLICVIDGQLSATYSAPTLRLTLTEPLPKLKVIEPYNLFGITRQYTRTYTFTTDGVTLAIDKRALTTQLMADDIVKINVLNLACSQCQKARRLLLSGERERGIRGRIAAFTLARSLTENGERHLKIRMADLAAAIGETRLNVSHTLNAMEREGLVKMSRGAILIPAVEKI